MAVTPRSRAVIGSIGLHGLAIALVARCELDPERTSPTIESTATPRVELTPIELATFELISDAPALDPATPLAPGGRAGTRRGIARTGTASAGGAELGRGEPTGLLTMRGRRHDLSLSGDVLARILAGGSPPPSIATDERLRPSGGGAHAVQDLVTTMRVARDGGATFTDKPDFDIRLALPILGFEDARQGMGRWLTRWRDDPYRDQRAAPIQEMARHMTAVPGACEKWGDPMCEPESDRPMSAMSGDAQIVGIFKGRADLGGYLHRKLVGDPYASRKLKLLDSTREARAQIGATYRSEQLGRAAELVQRNLHALWRATPDLAERKAALFALWDECLEGEGPAGEAGARARMIVIGWIRAKLPAGSAGAFTAEEIAKLDASRTSRQHFAPY